MINNDLAQCIRNLIRISCPIPLHLREVLELENVNKGTMENPRWVKLGLTTSSAIY